MAKSMDSSSSESEFEHNEMESDPEEISEDRDEIRQDLKSMSFAEIMKLKEELGAKVYKEAVFGVTDERKRAKAKKGAKEFKRLNKNRPREVSAKRQVPFLGTAPRTKALDTEQHIRDPRFDERAGEYDANKFKNNYKFVTDIRHKEVHQLKRQLYSVKDADEGKEIKETMQRLVNQNVEDRRWHAKQALAHEERAEIQKARAEGKQPHFLTKKERNAKELVMQFEQLKKAGRLTKHMEKRRKKNVSKDRKKISFD